MANGLAALLFVVAISVASCSEAPASMPETSIPAFPQTPSLLELVEASVVMVVAGDAIDVEIDGERYRVRYLGVASPDSANSTLNLLAKEANRWLVEGQTVLLEKDVTDSNHLGELLRYVWRDDGIMVNATLVSVGYAQAATFEPDVRYSIFLNQLERQARRHNWGMWRSRTAISNTRNMLNTRVI